MKGVLKCKWCEYRVPLWNGKRPTGYSRLAYHAEFNHEDEYDKVIQYAFGNEETELELSDPLDGGLDIAGGITPRCK